MKKLILAILLIVASTSAMAEWTMWDEDNSTKQYVDYASIRKTGDMVKMWNLQDHKTIKHEGNIPYLSTKGQDEYGCTSKTWRALSFIVFSGHMGGGKVLYQDVVRGEAKPVLLGSLGEARWKVACGKK